MSKHGVDIKVKEGGGITTVRLDGAIETEGAEQLKLKVLPLCAEEGAIVLLDCTHLDYINSASMGLLTIFHKSCATNQGKFVVYGVSEKILNILKLVCLDQMLTICASRDEALEAVG